jgi:hypothetical protein
MCPRFDVIDEKFLDTTKQGAGITRDGIDMQPTT